MSVTVPDDELVRTHDEARELLKYAALGATVIIERPRVEHQPHVRTFTLVLDAAPHHAVNALDVYSLPCNARVLAKRARTLCDRGQQSIARSGRPT